MPDPSRPDALPPVPRITGHTRLVAHLGLPTESFRAPTIYNPYFAASGIDAVVVPMGCAPADFAAFLPLVARLSNFTGALITMPHKVTVVDLLDEISPTVAACGACNAVRRDAAGRLIGEMFDGAGFVRGLHRQGHETEGASALVVGAGGVGAAIAASLAAAGVDRLELFDTDDSRAATLARRIAARFPATVVRTGSRDPAGRDIVVNATPLGMKPADPLPLDVTRLAPGTLVGEVVLTVDETPLIRAARARGCPTLIGSDMLFEQIPAYLEFFGLPTTTADHLRHCAETPT